MPSSGIRVLMLVAQMDELSDDTRRTGRTFAAVRHLFLALLLLLPNVISAQDVDPIRIGVLHSQTGTMAISESPLIDAVRLAVDQVNDAGGVQGRPLEMVVVDTQSDPEVAAREAERLIVDEQVVSLFGCWTSACRKALLPVLERHRALLWYPVQYEGQEASRNIIYTGAAPNQQIIPAVDWAVSEFGRRLFLVGSDYVFPRTANLIVRERADQLDATIVGEVYLPLGATDVEAVIDQIVAVRPELIINTINGDTNVDFFFELARATRSARIPTLSFSIAEGEIRTIGTHHLQGSYVAWNYFQSVDTPDNLDFVAAIRQSSGPAAVTSDPIEAAYFQVLAFAEAVSNASDLTPMGIRDSALGLTMVAPGGLVRIDEEWQHTWKTVRIGEIMPDGQIREEIQSIVPIAPSPFAGGHARAPTFAVGRAGMSLPASDYVALLGDTSRVGEAALLIRLTDARGWSIRDRNDLLLRAAGSENFVLRYEAFVVAARVPDARAEVAQALMVSGEPFDLVMAMRLLADEPELRPRLAQEAVSLLDHSARQVRRSAGNALLAQSRLGWRAGDAETSSIVSGFRDSDLAVQRNAIALSLYSNELGSRVLRIVAEEDYSQVPAFFRASICTAAAGVVTGALAMQPAAEETQLLGRIVTGLDRASCLTPATLASLRTEIRRVQAAQAGGLLILYGNLLREHTVLGVALTIILFVIIIELLALLASLGILVLRPASLIEAIRSATWLDGAHRFSLWGLQVNLFNALSPTWLVGHRRVLRAWVHQNLSAYRDAFAQRPTVRARRKHVLLPVLIGEERTPLEPTPEIIRKHLRGERLKMHIAGEGGTGKTSLVCQIARWSMSDSATDRLGRPRGEEREAMIAVFFEPGVHIESHLEGVLKAIQRELTIDSRLVPLWLVRRLIDAGYVLAVFDDIQEISGLDPELLAVPELRALRLAVTSRADMPAGSGDWDVVRPLKLKGRVLTEFFVSYAKISGEVDKLGDDDIEVFVTQFKSLLGADEARQETVVYFARLFLDYVFDLKQQGALEEGATYGGTYRRPQSVPELVESFVDSTCRHAAKRHELQRVEVVGLVRETAYHAIAERCRPGPFSFDVIRGREDQLREGLGISRLVELPRVLMDSGLLDQPTPRHFRFKVDLIQEYAAVLHLRDRATSCTTGAEAYAVWRDWVDRIVNSLGPDVAGSGLLRATYECLCSDRVATEVPDDLLRFVTSKLGIEARDLQPIRIGILHSLQGTMAMSETPLRDAALLAVEEVNASGGIGGRRLEATVRDGASHPTVFAAQARRLIREDGVSSIFGCWTSAARMAVKPVVEAERSLLWYPVQYEGYEESDAIIYTGAAPNQQILPAVDWCLSTLLPDRGVDPRTAKIYLVGSDYVFPRRANAIVRSRLQEAGLEPAGERYIPLGGDDFDGILSDIEQATPDVILNTLNGSSNIGFFQSLAAHGYDASSLPVVSLSIAEAEVRDIGVSRMRGHYAVWNYFQSLATEANARFVRAFQKEYGLGRVTSDPIATAYLQIILFAEAARRTRPLTRDELLEALSSIEIDTPAGAIRFDPATRHFFKNVYVGQINDDGQFEIVNPDQSLEMVRPMPFPYEELRLRFAMEDETLEPMAG